MNTLERAKYRGKCVYTGKWAYGMLGLCQDLESEAIVYCVTLISDKNCICDTQINPETVGQFTGLTDKNKSVDIYEGDMISCSGICVGDIYDGKEITASLTVPVIAGEDWASAYKEMLERGCVHS